MKKNRCSEERIIGIPKEQQAGLPVTEICRRHGISDATFSTWRSRYGGMEVSDTGAAVGGRSTPSRTADATSPVYEE